jgi:hypothetical protein
VTNSKPINFMLAVVVTLAILVSAGPTLVAVMHAAIPLIAVGGVVAVILRLVFFHTRRW